MTSWQSGGIWICVLFACAGGMAWLQQKFGRWPRRRNRTINLPAPSNKCNRDYVS